MALRTQIRGPVGDWTVSASPGATDAFAAQDYQGSQVGRTYSFWSGALTSVQTPDLPGTRTELRRTSLRVTDQPNASRYLGQTMEADGIVLDNPVGFTASGQVELNRNLAQWTAGPYFAHLIVQTDPASNTTFRLCWNLKLPQVIRLSCGIFDRTTAVFRGVHIVDDSFGLGQITWRPANPPASVPAPPPPTPAATVSGNDVRLALLKGVPLAEPFPPNFGGGPSAIVVYQYEHMRRIHASDGSEMRIWGESYASGSGSVMSGMPGGVDERTGRPYLLRASNVQYKVDGSTLTVDGFPAGVLDLGGTLPLDKVARQWGEGSRYVQLLPQSIPGRPSDFRLCWLYLSDSASPPVYRLQCSEHRRGDGVNVGAFIVDDVAGATKTYAGTWQ